MNDIYTHKMVVQPPISESKSITLKCNGFILQNVGTTEVLIDRAFTLQPGQAINTIGIMYDVFDQVCDLQFGDINVITTGGPVIKKVEIMEFIKGDKVNC